MEELEGLGFVEVTQYNCGVYVLVYNGKILYVGQSMEAFQRIGQHRGNMRQVRLGRRKHGEYGNGVRYMLFNEVYFIACGRDELDKLELETIAQLEPKFNKTLGNAFLKQRDPAVGTQKLDIWAMM